MVKIPVHKNAAQALLFHEGAKKMSPEDVYHTPAHETRRKGTLGLAKKTGLGALALVTLGVGAKHLNSESTQHFDKIEAEALKEARTGWNAVVVLHEGATFRTVPKSVNSGAEDGPDTVAGRVGKGEVLRIDRPIAYVEKGADQSKDNYWFGFTLRGEKGQTTDGADKGNVYWVNFSQLQRESTNEHNYVSVYDYTTVNDSMETTTGPVNYSVTVDSEGNFTNNLGRKGGPAATASTIPENIFDQMAANERLIISHGK